MRLEPPPTGPASGGRYTNRRSISDDPLQAPAPYAHAAARVPGARRVGRHDGGARESVVRAGLAGKPRDRSRALRLDGRLARRLLPRREDRLHRQPDDPHRRGLRAAGGRPPADDCCSARTRPRRFAPRRAWTRRSCCGRSTSRSTRAPVRSPSKARSIDRARGTYRLTLAIDSGGGTRTETRELPTRR